LTQTEETLRDPAEDPPGKNGLPEDEAGPGFAAAESGKIQPRTFRGTRDFLPAEMIRREELFAYLRRVFQRYGFAPLETPAMEYLDILLGKYGREGEKLIYPLAYKGGNVLALHYDLTVPLARVVAQHPELPRPFKRYQMQAVWRADRPQLVQGRYREFYQCDADIVGESHLLADAEILALSAEILTGLGLGRYRILINHRQILRGIVESASLPPEAAPAVLRAIDKVDKVGVEGIEGELAAEGIEPEPRRRILDLLAQPSGGEEAIAALASRHGGIRGIAAGCVELAEIWRHLRALGLSMEPFEFRLTLARGLDYYTGAVFESFVESLPHVGSLTGGGRYDGLVGLFSTEEVPAVGTTIGLDRIITALEQIGRTAARSSRTQVLVLQFGPESAAASVAMTGRLRLAGLNTEVWYRPERLKKQLAQADRRGVPIVLFQGPDEVARGEWVAKLLRSGEQRSIPEAAVPETLSRWLEEAGFSAAGL
jgi:histidyl-tRNA synthetase